MPASLLRTKLYIPPPRPGLVPRPRLLERLNAGLHSKLTLLSAPAGFGKTTLLSEWIAGCECPVAWLSLDKGDNDPIRFLAYFVAALQTARDDIGTSAMVALQSPQPPSIQFLLTELINEIAGNLTPLVLVLDDYHHISARPIHDAITFLLDHLPVQMHLILATRADPPLSLARLRAVRELEELRAAELRFTPDEAALFLNDIMGLELSAEDVAALETRTEGWIAGLQMASLAMQIPSSRGEQRRTAAFIREFGGSHRFIMDYLVEEVLDQQSSEVREFLLKTSILERMTGSLCDAILDNGPLTTGDRPSSAVHRPSPNSQEILERLERANLFVVPLDGERCWYRYHHLFADLLYNQLILTYPDQVPILHQRASEWFEDEGFVEDTMTHAFDAKDDERVARLVEKYARDMLHQSKYNILSSWIEALPDKLVQQRPWLCLYQSWTRHWAGMREGGENCLTNAEQMLSSSQFVSEDEKRLLPAYIATVRAHYALTNGEISRVLDQAQKALRLLPQDDYFTRGTAAIALGGAYWGIGDVFGAEQAFTECASNALKGGYYYRASSALCYVGMQQVKQGRLQKARETFSEALALSQGPGGIRYPNAGYPLSKLAELACEWNQLEQARRDADDGVKLCMQLGHVDLIAEAYAALARVQLAQQDFGGARDTLERSDRLSRQTKLDPWALCWLDDCRLRLWIKTDKLDEALGWVQRSGLGVDDELSFHHDLHHINLARALVAQGREQVSELHLDQALGLLERLLEAAERAGWIHETIKILILRAMAHQARGDGDRALVALARALTLAKPADYIRTFIDEGMPIGELLRQAVTQGVEANYAGTLLAALENETKLFYSPLVEPLSERELEVLRLLTTSMTSVEIANELIVSVHTVRSHIKSIYGKLDVHRRMEAVERARELGLI